jgi:hypothetical protein
MKKQKQPKEEVSERIERYSQNHVVLFAVVFFGLFSLTKMDSEMMKTLKTSYAFGAGLIDEYAREEPTRTPPNIGSEIRLTTVSGT